MEEITPAPDKEPEPENSLPQEELPSNDIPEEIKTFEIAGFWNRFLAFALDGLILGIPLIILGFVFRDFAFSLGPWGRLLGYGIIFLYWTYLSIIN